MLLFHLAQQAMHIPSTPVSDRALLTRDDFAFNLLWQNGLCGINARVSTTFQLIWILPKTVERLCSPLPSPSNSLPICVRACDTKGMLSPGRQSLFQAGLSLLPSCYVREAGGS